MTPQLPPRSQPFAAHLLLPSTEQICLSSASHHPLHQSSSSPPVIILSTSHRPLRQSSSSPSLVIVLSSASHRPLLRQSSSSPPPVIVLSAHLFKKAVYLF
ncbi:hypothetical protein SLEP1_g41153 [Rubroshorea leprosula]|uniref:Uncharacterized protein n=1 Tax=Rubroshorea leprosula TaxID=152421 RepID=A0AAV5L646_9ROSI|nr:hypothetical protein SLEP1_g41153 [Rubroshorea leprosula]